MARTGAGSAAAGIQKSLDRINAQVASGAFYEAQQMYKTVYHRCKSRRQTADSYQVLTVGAVTQLRNQQLTCGVELANMLIEALKTDKVEAGENQLGMIYDILEALPTQLQLADPDSTAELDEFSRWVMAVLKWAHKQGADAAVHTIHDKFAAWVWRAYGWKQFGKAALHYSRGADAAAYAAVINTVSSRAGSAEDDLFVTRAVLQTLACAHAANADRQLQHAAAVLESCKALQPALAQQPLVRFCDLLLQALQLRKHALMTLLQSQYEPSLEFDPSFEAYLTTIEQVYFNVRPSGGAGGGFLGSLLRGLLEGDELDDE